MKKGPRRAPWQEPGSGLHFPADCPYTCPNTSTVPPVGALPENAHACPENQAF